MSECERCGGEGGPVSAPKRGYAVMDEAGRAYPSVAAACRALGIGLASARQDPSCDMERGGHRLARLRPGCDPEAGRKAEARRMRALAAMGEERTARVYGKG